MDLTKIGKFLQELRKEKGLTQEDLAEQLNVARRTVSRWETGSNMPDLDILIELSDIYEVDLREILNGERKSEKMNEEVKEVVLKAADYTSSKAERYNRRIHALLLAGAICLLISGVIHHTVLNENHILLLLSEFAEGAGIGMLLCGLFFSNSYGQKIKAFKKRLLSNSENR